jgi:hypothetical protein
MATPTFVKTTVSKDGTKLRDEYSDGSFKNVRANPDFISPRQKIINDAVAAQAVKDAAIQAAKDAAKGRGPESRIQQAAKKLNTEVPLLIEPYGYGTDKLHHSKYDKEQWQKWAKETEFKPKSTTVAGQNKEFQEHLLTHPDFKDKVLQIHKDLGMPYADKPEDAFLGERWDKIMEKLTKKKEDPAPPGGDKTIADTGNKKKDDETKPFETNTPVNQSTPGNTPFWLQDIIQTAGAASDLARLKKYLPWQATPEVRLPDATFYDPTRELAANTEMANMAMQNSAAFTNPQQQAAANSVAQGQMAKAAADTMGRYNNLNVGLANQLSQERTGIMNAASQNKANLDTQLWDKYTIANQQFDNSKTKARQNLRESYINAITNRANTANMNSLYPEYYADPSTGGFIKFNPNAAKIKPIDKYDQYDILQKKAQQYSSDPIIQERYFNHMLNKGVDDGEDDYYNKLKKMTERGWNKSNQSNQSQEAEE